MALDDNNFLGQEELEVFEIDEAVLRDLLETEYLGDNTTSNMECIVQSVEAGNDASNAIISQQQPQQQQLQQPQQHSCLECNINEFEWLNLIEIEPILSTDVMMNWYGDEIAGLVDFGCVNGVYDSQIYDGVFSTETIYGCLWEAM
ncbi:Ribonuclease [Quillaja saponaria]|nr:Ribonuclease [Quillaja saponaria]